MKRVGGLLSIDVDSCTWFSIPRHANMHEVNYSKMWTSAIVLQFTGVEMCIWFTINKTGKGAGARCTEILVTISDCKL